MAKKYPFLLLFWMLPYTFKFQPENRYPRAKVDGESIYGIKSQLHQDVSVEKWPFGSVFSHFSPLRPHTLIFQLICFLPGHKILRHINIQHQIRDSTERLLDKWPFSDVFRHFGPVCIYFYLIFRIRTLNWTANRSVASNQSFNKVVFCVCEN